MVIPQLGCFGPGVACARIIDTVWYDRYEPHSYAHTNSVLCTCSFLTWPHNFSTPPSSFPISSPPLATFFFVRSIFFLSYILFFSHLPSFSHQSTSFLLLFLLPPSSHFSIWLPRSSSSLLFSSPSCSSYHPKPLPTSFVFRSQSYEAACHFLTYLYLPYYLIISSFNPFSYSQLC